MKNFWKLHITQSTLVFTFAMWHLFVALPIFTPKDYRSFLFSYLITIIMTSALMIFVFINLYKASKFIDNDFKDEEN